MKYIIITLLFIPLLASGFWNSADINDDGIVNEEDATILSINWQRKDCERGNEWCQRADLNEDGSVDDKDASILAGNWGKERPSEPVVVSEPVARPGGGFTPEARIKWQLANVNFEPLDRLELQLKLIEIELGKLLKEISEFLK